MSGPGNLWICIGFVRQPDTDLTAEFLVDARSYPDAEAARAVVREAGDELDRRRIATEFEFIYVRESEPTPDLPTWHEYRRRALTDDGAPR